jgi:hypothetical protein
MSLRLGDPYWLPIFVGRAVDERHTDALAIGRQRRACIDRPGTLRRLGLERSPAVVRPVERKDVPHGRQLGGDRLDDDCPFVDRPEHGGTRSDMPDSSTRAALATGS